MALNVASEAEEIAQAAWESCSGAARWNENLKSRPRIESKILWPTKEYGAWLEDYDRRVHNRLVEDLQELDGLEDEWNGPGSRRVTRETLEQARLVVRTLPERAGTVAPTDSGSVLFEWEFDSGVTLFVTVTDSIVSVSLFDDHHTYVDLSTTAQDAAHLVRTLMSLRTVTPS